MDSMSVIENILGVCKFICQKVETMKSNKERCQRVAQRVRALEELVQTIKQRGPDQISTQVDKALRELCVTLVSAKNLVVKFSQTKAFKSFLKSKDHEEKFCRINERLTDNFQVLSGALQIEQGDVLNRVYQSVSTRRRDTPLPVPASSPTTPTPLPMPTTQMPLAMATAPIPPPTPVYYHTASISPFVVSPRPVSIPVATRPVIGVMSRNMVTGTMSPLQTAVISQRVAAPASSVVMSPTAAPLVFVPQAAPVAPMTLSTQPASLTGLAQTFLR